MIAIPQQRVGRKPIPNTLIKLVWRRAKVSFYWSSLIKT